MLPSTKKINCGENQQSNNKYFSLKIKKIVVAKLPQVVLIEIYYSNYLPTIN